MKVVLLGDTGVGKSSLVSRFSEDTFRPFSAATVGASFVSKTVEGAEGGPIQFQIWDTAGQEKYHSLAPMYYCLLYTSPSPRDLSTSRMPSSA